MVFLILFTFYWLVANAATNPHPPTQFEQRSSILLFVSFLRFFWFPTVTEKSTTPGPEAPAISQFPYGIPKKPYEFGTFSPSARFSAFRPPLLRDAPLLLRIDFASALTLITFGHRSSRKFNLFAPCDTRKNPPQIRIGLDSEKCGAPISPSFFRSKTARAIAVKPLWGCCLVFIVPLCKANCPARQPGKPGPPWPVGSGH